MRCLVAYLSYSENTQEIAELIAARLCSRDIQVDLQNITVTPTPPDISRYDIIFLGTFTWDYGEVPDEVKDYILDIGYKPSRMAIFGSGDTQFGSEESGMFCRAVKKLVKFYGSKWPGLEIEQSPRGTQESKVNYWVERVLSDVIDES